MTERCPNYKKVMEDIYGSDMGMEPKVAMQERLELAQEVAFSSNHSNETHRPVVNFKCDDSGRELF